ncbi:MAG: CoB--CoM heterodisulfide reductase iron-sulfur subunit B family protein [Prevotellaceae bacterium]|jgi:heterodisulfide reductase subunit B|nr:CoB--CoM heterodisulfide reductase iron-sulfur subunit B family protein [Prevotellaceae bacterium]
MEKKRIGFYPGCSLTGTAGEYNHSVKAIAKAFNVELAEVPDWNCCGATAAHNLNKALSLSLPARILANAEEAGMTEVLVPCAACSNRLLVAQHELQEDPKLKAEIEEIIGKKFENNLNIINVIQFIQTYVLPTLAEKVTKPFNKKSACYYGCLLVRPYKILKFDRAEDPQTMDEVMKAIGSEPVDFPFKTECCGAGLSVSRTELVGKLSGKIVKEAADRGAEAIIVACPMCHANLDMRRGAINKAMGLQLATPVLYITQAIALAVGISANELGLNKHIVPVKF